MKSWLLIFVVGLFYHQSHQFPADTDADENNYALERNLEHSREPLDDWNEIFADNYKDLIDNSASRDEDSLDDDEEIFSGKLDVVEQWPVNEIAFGEISGLATDSDGYLYALHRANRKWTEGMFDEHNVYSKKIDGPINETTMFTVNASNGVVINKWGGNLFYLPHGLTIDSSGNRWITDVATHQVFKFEPNKNTPSLTLGRQFEPAKNHKDTERFCQPTDVAIASNGDIFVSDGYCASRVMKFDKNGKFLRQFGLDDAQIPHSIALLEDVDLVCTADREGMRVLCYNAGIGDASLLGEPEREYTDDSMGRVFSIDYSPTDGVLYAVTGPTGVLTSQGFTIDMRDDSRYKTDIIANWSPDEQGFEAPHAVTVSPDGEAVFVGEINGKNNLWKFMKEL